MRQIVLRRDAEVANPVEVAAEFLEKWAYETDVDASPMSFAEPDLRRANRGGARISAAEIAAILERRGEIERALHAIPADASLAAARSIPWAPLTRLFDAFAGIRGVGFSKMTKALHKKRPALIPMLDSVVQAYLAADTVTGSFGERAIELVRRYKADLDRNRAVLRAVRRELARRGYDVTEVRLLDLMIWSAFA
jgi:hypothetical protein